jgi:hypothetical protein
MAIAGAGVALVPYPITGIQNCLNNNADAANSAFIGSSESGGPTMPTRNTSASAWRFVHADIDIMTGVAAKPAIR